MYALCRSRESEGGSLPDFRVQSHTELGFPAPGWFVEYTEHIVILIHIQPRLCGLLCSTSPGAHTPKLKAQRRTWE